jgi:hypothetical protein
MLESRPHRAAHPDRPSCGAFRTTVEPAGTANRTSRYQRGKRTGFWHTVQFSRCERRPEGRDSRRWGRATHHGRHACRGRQPNSCPGPALLRFAQRIPAVAALERSFEPRWQDPRLAGQAWSHELLWGPTWWRSPTIPGSRQHHADLRAERTRRRRRARPGRLVRAHAEGSFRGPCDRGPALLRRRRRGGRGALHE